MLHHYQQQHKVSLTPRCSWAQPGKATKPASRELIWMPDNYISSPKKFPRWPIREPTCFKEAHSHSRTTLPWHLGQIYMPTTALNMEGVHHCSLGQSHFSRNWSQMALIVPLLRLPTGATLLQQHLTKGCLQRVWVWQERETLQLPKASAGNCREGDSASLKLLYVCWQRQAQLPGQCPPESDPW